MKQVEEIIIEHVPPLMKQIQSKLDYGCYIDSVVKDGWPKESTVHRVTFTPVCLPTAEKVHYEERTYRLQQAAIQSPNICLEDLRFTWAIEDLIKNIERLFIHSLEWLWHTTFRRDIIRITQTHRVARWKPLHPIMFDLLPRKVDFFGKEVSAFVPGEGKKKYCINPKYKRAATQYVEFHPDIVHFLFPNLENWAGELQYRNFLDVEHNSNDRLAFFRIMMQYAAKPTRPDLGSVTTVPPPGFLGTLWYWAWKLVRFIP